MSNDADPPDVPDDATDEPQAEPEDQRRRLPILRGRAVPGDDPDSRTQRIASQLAQLRYVRRAEPEPIVTGTSNFDRAQVPWGLDLAAAWAWRLIIIAAAGYGIFWVIGYFSVITLPLAVALLITALVSPAVNALTRVGVPRGLAAITMVLGGLAAIALLLTFAGQQVATGAEDLADSTVEGLDKIRTWLQDGPLNASDSQIEDYIQTAQDAIRDRTSDGALQSVGEIGTAVGHVFAGLLHHPVRDVLLPRRR